MFCPIIILVIYLIISNIIFKKSYSYCFINVLISQNKDFINIVISVLISYFISKTFYDKSNHNAFCNDILIPIGKLNDCNDILNKIDECSASYLYQYAKKEEIETIDELYSAAKESINNNYKNAFKESIMNYFYSIYNWERKHPCFNDEINEIILELNYDERVLNIEDYSIYFIDGDNYDKYYQDKLSELLYDFYISNGGDKENIIFKDKNIEEIFHKSDEYKLFIKAQVNFDAKKEKFKQLESCRKLMIRKRKGA